MRDAEYVDLMDVRHVDTRQALDYCIDRLIADTEHGLNDSVVSGLSFEELIGALVAARAERDRDLQEVTA